MKVRPEKIEGLYGIWTHDLCDTGLELYQLSKQANWELVIMLVHNKPVKWWSQREFLYTYHGKKTSTALALGSMYCHLKDVHWKRSNSTNKHCNSFWLFRFSILWIPLHSNHKHFKPVYSSRFSIFANPVIVMQLLSH